MRERLVGKMIDFYEGNHGEIAHFLKVYAYADTIGRMEGLSGQALETLALAAIVHDIACPLCRAKYGSAGGAQQEAESEGLLRPFLAEFDLPAEMRERIIWLVCHHHTYDPVDGPDHQILLEADYLVNAGQSGQSREAIERFGERVYRTEGGKRLLRAIYLR